MLPLLFLGVQNITEQVKGQVLEATQCLVSFEPNLTC